MEPITAFISAHLTAVIILYSLGVLLSTLGMGYLFGALGEMEKKDYALSIGAGFFFPIVIPVFVGFALVVAVTHSIKLLLGRGKVDERGFTLIELMIVILIFSIILLLVAGVIMLFLF